MNDNPSGISVNKNKRELTITWKDGHLSVFPFSLLRAACPCASCRGGHENMGSEPDPKVFNLTLEESPATTLENVVPVGSYALSIVWGDGHDYGIFNWHYLRALCTCLECRKQ